MVLNHFLAIPNILFALLTATIRLADIFIELKIYNFCYSPSFSLLPAQSYMWAEGCFPPRASSLCPITEILQFFSVFNHLYYPENFCIMTKPCHFTVYSFPVHERFVSKQHIHPGDITAAKPLPQDLTMSSHSLFPVFLIHSFFIHPETFHLCLGFP